MADPRAGTEGNPTPHQPLRVPHAMWQAFGRVCKRLGTNRNARVTEFIRAEIRRHGDERDLADLEAADEELRERRSRKGLSLRPRTAGGPEAPPVEQVPAQPSPQAARLRPTQDDPC